MSTQSASKTRGLKIFIASPRPQDRLCPFMPTGLSFETICERLLCASPALDTTVIVVLITTVIVVNNAQHS